MLAGVAWLACDDGTPAPGDAPPPNVPARDAGASGAEERGVTRPVEEPSGSGGASSGGASSGDADAGGGIGGAAVTDAGSVPADSVPADNDCCSESASPGCSNAPVLECVCAGDAACCSESYDALCVAEAITRCALACPVPAPESDCSTPSDVPSCRVPEIAQCVCAIDPFCCTFRFDANCVTLAAAECSGATPPAQGAQP